MQYLTTETVLGSFGEFLRDDVSEALPEDQAFVRAQVGSASSTLRFLERTESGRRAATNRQQQALRGALVEVDARVNSTPADLGDLPAILATERERIAALSPADLDDFEREEELLESCNDVLTAIERETADIDDDADATLAPRLRAPLYEFIEERFRSHLAMLGRDD